VPTAFGPRPSPCLPTASPTALARRRTHHFCRPRPPPRAAFKRSVPPRQLPFSSSAHCCHCAIEPLGNATPVPLRTLHPRPKLRTNAGSSPDLLTGALGCSSPPPPFFSGRAELPRTTCSSHHPIVSTHPKHRAVEYILPNYSDPIGDPYSGLPPSLPRRRSPPP
jgi:hypothetical protein